MRRGSARACSQQPDRSRTHARQPTASSDADSSSASQRAMAPIGRAAANQRTTESRGRRCTQTLRSHRSRRCLCPGCSRSGEWDDHGGCRSIFLTAILTEYNAEDAPRQARAHTQARTHTHTHAHTHTHTHSHTHRHTHTHTHTHTRTHTHTLTHAHTHTHTNTRTHTHAHPPSQVRVAHKVSVIGIVSNASSGDLLVGAVGTPYPAGRIISTVPRKSVPFRENRYRFHENQYPAALIISTVPRKSVPFPAIGNALPRGNAYRLWAFSTLAAAAP
jgi:hypothetical protein